MTMKKLDAIIKNSLRALMFCSIFNIINCYAEVSVGASYGGGTVFCVSKTQPNGVCDPNQCVTVGSGDCGLIMANEDQANYDSNDDHGVAWASDYRKTGAQSDDDGAANTAAILRAFPDNSPGENAAKLCESHRGGEHDDWFLPAKNQLSKMYNFALDHRLIGRGCVGSVPGGVQCLIGGYGGRFFDFDDNSEEYRLYWSSTECPQNEYSASVRLFVPIGTKSYEDKIIFYYGVRAVRAFNQLNELQAFLLVTHPRLGIGSPINRLSPHPHLLEAIGLNILDKQ